MTAEDSLERLWSFYGHFMARGTLGPKNERLFKEALENIERHERVTEIEAEIEWLRSLLEPLASQAHNFDGFGKLRAVSIPVTVHDLRSARTALKQ
jgi:hypothetical protein